MRIAVGGFMHETNTFVPIPTSWDDFVRAGPWPTVTEGEAILSVFRGINLAIDAMPDKESKILHRRLGEHRANMEATLAGIKALAES